MEVEFITDNAVSLAKQQRTKTVTVKVCCPICGATFPAVMAVNGLGRKRYNIPYTNICKALDTCSGNYSDAARMLSKEYGIKVSPGFVASRIKREKGEE